MSRCVPSWDAAVRDADQLGGGGGGSSSCLVTSNNMFYVSKSKTWDRDDRHGLANQLPAAVPEYDQVAELTWKDGHPAMQDLGSRAPNRGQKLGCSSFGATAYQWAGDQPAVVLTRRSHGNDKEVEGTLDAIVARSLDVPVPNLPAIDEDVVSWFQCPFSDLQEPPPLKKPDKNNNNNGINNDPDALVPSTTSSDKAEYAFVHSIPSKSQASTPGNILSLPKERDGSINFSHFSKPAVMMKAHLQALGSASGPTNIKRVRQYSSVDAEVAVSNGMPDSIVGSTQGAGGGPCGTHSEDSRPALSTHANTLNSKNCPAPPPNQPGRKSSKAMLSGTTTTITATTTSSDHDGMIAKAVEDQSRTSVTFGKEIATSDLNYDAMEVTLVSTSGGSPNHSMTEKTGKEPCSTKWKRKSRDDEDSGCQSEDDDQSAQAKKSLAGRRSNSNKRSRAAAVHNQSERRRRDRINEKMRSLQKLIPNSSKTDKASMLDEAIEYLKHLQAQLQMMCLRNGMNIPPMMLPFGMQQIQMSLLASLGTIGLGMGMAGMGLGMGMGMMDMNPLAATGRAAMVPMGQPLPSTGIHALPVSVHPATFIQPNLAAAAAAAGFPAASALVPDTNDRLQNSALVDPYSAFMACQRQSMNMDLYNSMVLLQQQQLLHQQQQQQQQPPQLVNPYHQQQQQQHSHPQQQQHQMDSCK